MNSPKRFEPGKTYLCWNTDSISWTVHRERSNEIHELHCLAVSPSGCVKLKHMITGHVVWNSSRHPWKIMEELPPTSS